MGLAASQARFLNLTARKTNIEYEGQQINQQRTALANQSANYYSQMLTLSVPVPPSESNYSTVVYTFTMNGETCTINQVTNATGNANTANIIYTRTYTNNYNMNQNDNYRNITNNNGTYKFNDNQLRALNDSNLDGNVFTQTVKEDIVKALGFTQGSNDFDKVYVLNVGSNSNPSYEYYKKSDLPTGASGNVYGYTAGSVTAYEQKSVSGVTITRDVNNRISAISAPGTLGTDIAVTSSTIKDSIAYNDAYAEYEYQTYLYQQKMEEINAQTSVIQAQDKKLELRLKQLDTEQSAISTEMDNISSLIDKNVENSFKVFG